MSFTAAVRSVLSQYVGFSGRARRSEYWWFFLFSAVVGIVASLLDSVLGTDFESSATSGIGASLLDSALGTDLDSSGPSGLFSLIANLVLLLPSLAVGIRRLHDTERSGWWILIGLIPILGLIVLSIFFVQDGTSGPNRFGASPKYQTESG